MFSDTPFDAVALLSIIEFINIVTICIYYNIRISRNSNFDMFIGISILLSLNALAFLNNKRYKTVVQKFSNSDLKNEELYTIAVVIYTLVTISIFYIVHKGKYFPHG
jgi:hypothetical protein